jgi:hypothetical protein
VSISGKVLAFPITAMSAITRDPGDLFLTPPGLFLTFVASKALSQFNPWVAPAPRLGGPWVAQG